MAAFTIAGIRFPALQAGSLLPSSGVSARSGHHGERSSTNLSLLSRKDASPRWKIFAGNSSYNTDSASTTVTSGKVLVPGVQIDEPSTPTSSAEGGQAASKDPQVFHDGIQIEDKAEAEQEKVTSEVMVSGEGEDEEAEISTQTDESDRKLETKPRSVPPPGTGQKIYEIDPMLEAYRAHLEFR